MLPHFVALRNTTVTVQLGGGVPPAFRNFGVLSTASFQTRTFSIASPNRPQEQRALYNARTPRWPAARGLSVGASLFVPYACERAGWAWWLLHWCCARCCARCCACRCAAPRSSHFCELVSGLPDDDV